MGGKKRGGSMNRSKQSATSKSGSLDHEEEGTDQKSFLNEEDIGLNDTDACIIFFSFLCLCSFHHFSGNLTIFWLVH